MVVRTINNDGAPLADSLGEPLADALLSFQLVDRYGRVVRNAMDAVSEETISTGSVSVYTDAGGLFGVALWPTGRGANSYYYRVRGYEANGRPVVDFTAPLPDDAGVLPWADFMALAGLWQDGQGAPQGGGAGGHVIVVNGVEQATRGKLELAGQGVTVETLADANKVTVSADCTDIDTGTKYRLVAVTDPDSGQAIPALMELAT